tara:strand:- start:3374 stop:3751 length:378 start_codon:yes stop_codon:yes gene_type:complete
MNPLDMMDEEEASQYENFYQEQLMQEQQEYEHQKKRTKLMWDGTPKDNEIRLFTNKYKEDGDRKPDLTGTGLVRGVKTKAAAWINKDKNGNEYFNIKYSDPDPQYDNPSPSSKPAVQYAKNDVPF